LVLAASLASTPAVFAAPFGFGGHTPVNAAPKVKNVKFTLRNDSTSPIKVKIGDQEMTLAPGKPVDVKAASGLTVVSEEASATNPAGTVLATVTDVMGGATVVVR
jgi:hypothetical protein